MSGILAGIAGFGPGLEQGLNAKELRAASKSQRGIAEAEEGRSVDQHRWKQNMSRDMELRGMMEDPVAWDQYFRFGQGEGPVAPNPALAAGPPATTQQQTIESVIPALAKTSGFQDGGAIEVPPQQGGLPQAPPPQAPPPQAPVPKTTRRDRYNQWYSNASKNAVLTGGLEGYKMFQDMENATSRRQVMGYGLQAVRSLNEGNVGEAMRAGNSALEVTPFDTGMKFEAKEGKLHMVGADGKPGDPLSAQHLMAFVDDHMKTPEKYLDWKKQYETERAALVKEGQEDTRLDIYSRGVGVQEGHLDIAEGMMPANLSKVGAEIYSLIKNADAAAQRAINAGADGVTISPELKRSINNDIPTLIQNAKLDPGKQWWGPMMSNPGLAGAMQSGAIDVALLNHLGSGNYADAIGVSAFAYAPAAGISVEEVKGQMGGIGIEGEGDTAYPYAVWNGKKLAIPSSLYAALQIQREALLAQGNDTGGEEPALPTENHPVQ